uniref:MADS transcription factor CaAGL6-1b n=1 Tax=Delphinium ajacis TaxID=37494 RepID=A0A977TIH2_DELAJ|nr:MADS transcription factor CaAGL6-1b [Consolida ajacis]
MDRTLERYQRSSYSTQGNNLTVADSVTQSWCQEVSKLKAKYESLQRSQRNLLGEDLGSLSVKELQNLETQLEGALTQARQRKSQMMLENMEKLRKKERHLGDMNKQLSNQLELEGQGSFRTMQDSWDSASLVGSSFSTHPSQSNATETEPLLQIGYHQYGSNGGFSVPRSNAGDNNCTQGWAL